MADEDDVELGKDTEGEDLTVEEAQNEAERIVSKARRGRPPKKEQASSKGFTVRDVPTQTTPVVYDENKKEALDTHAALAKILNDLEQLKGLL